MRLHGSLHDGQPKPKALGFPRAALIDAVEAIEYARCVLGSDSRAAVEENIFALGHSEPYANIKSAHPEIHAAMVQALTFRNDPKLLCYLASYEQKITKNFQVNLNRLLKLQSLRQPVLAREKVMTATGMSSFCKTGLRFVNPPRSRLRPTRPGKNDSSFCKTNRKPSRSATPL